VTQKGRKEERKKERKEGRKEGRKEERKEGRKEGKQKHNEHKTFFFRNVLSYAYSFRLIYCFSMESCIPPTSDLIRQFSIIHW